MCTYKGVVIFSGYVMLNSYMKMIMNCKKGVIGEEGNGFNLY
jgi:hypothetical protein